MFVSLKTRIEAGDEQAVPLQAMLKQLVHTDMAATAARMAAAKAAAVKEQEEAEARRIEEHKRKWLDAGVPARGDKAMET